MLNTASLVAWLVSIVTSEQHRPLNFWLLVVLGFLLLTALWWGLEASRGKPKTSPEASRETGSMVEVERHTGSATLSGNEGRILRSGSLGSLTAVKNVGPPSDKAER